jgi:hypothetical protein
LWTFYSALLWTFIIGPDSMPDMPNGDEQLACNSHNGEVLMLVAAKLLKLFLPIRAVLHGGTSGFIDTPQQLLSFG